MRKVLVGLIFSVICVNAVADDKFYTTVDAQGRVQVIKVESSEKKPEKPSSIQDQKKSIVIVPSPSKEEQSPSESQGIRQLGSETYIDTELLEKKNFNLEDKKRFYYLPDGGLGSRVVETKEGIVTRPVSIAEVLKPQLYVSSEYVLLSKEDIQDGYPRHKDCVNQVFIKKNSKPFKDSNNIWVQPTFSLDAIEVDGFLQMPTTKPLVKQLHVVSYASTQKKSTFYLPVVVFLDDKGCALSGAWHYWSRARAATEKQYASVDGLVNVPTQSAYVLFYRPISLLKADIPLSLESGSFVVEAY